MRHTVDAQRATVPMPTHLSWEVSAECVAVAPSSPETSWDLSQHGRSLRLCLPPGQLHWEMFVAFRRCQSSRMVPCHQSSQWLGHCIDLWRATQFLSCLQTHEKRILLIYSKLGPYSSLWSESCTLEIGGGLVLLSYFMGYPGRDFFFFFFFLTWAGFPKPQRTLLTRSLTTQTICSIGLSKTLGSPQTSSRHDRSIIR